MFFSNLLLYRLTQDLAKDLGIDGESLAHALKSKPAQPAAAKNSLPTASFLRWEKVKMLRSCTKAAASTWSRLGKRNASSPAASFVTH